MSYITWGAGSQVSAGDTTTVYWGTSTAGTKYVNSTGVTSYPRVSPKSANVGVGSAVFFPINATYGGNFTATFQEPVDHFNFNPPQAVASLSVNYTLRTGGVGGTVIATSGSTTVYRTPSAPTSLTSTNRTTNSITMRVSGGQWGDLQIKRGSGSYQTADSNGDVTFTGLTANAPYTFYARRKNGPNITSEISATVSTLSNTPVAPTVTANKGVIPNGFNLTTTTSGSTNGTITYQWSTTGGGPNNKAAYSTGYTSSSSLGVGVEWVGTTWTVQAKASVSGQSDVFSNTSSVTLPTFSISGPSSIEEDTQGTFSFTITNAIASTLYWQVTPTADFTTSSGSVGVAGQVGITPLNDNTTEGSETATFSLYINNTFNSQNLVATRTFTITDPPPTVTAPGAPTATANNASSQTVQVTVNRTTSAPGTNGTLQYAQTTSNSAPSSGWVTPSSGQTFVLFNQTRNTTRYYWARRSTTAVSPSTSLFVDYRTDFDSNVTISPSTRQVTSTGATDDQSATFTITATDGDHASSVYRLVTSSINPGWRASKAGESDGAADIVLEESEGDLPPDGTAATYTYQLSGKRTTQAGGPPNVDGNFTNISGQSVTVQRIVANETISPSAMNEGASQSFTTANNKLSNLQSSDTYYWKVFSPGNADFSTTQGSFTTDSSGSTSGFTLTTVSDQVTENAETATIRIYTSESYRNSDDGTGSNYEATADFTINDTSTASSGGGTGSGAGGTATYGLLVKNANATANIISPSQRVGGLIEYASIGTSIANASSLTLTGLPEITAANTNTVHFFIAPDLSITSQGTISYSNRGTGTITINNYSGASLPSSTKYYILRV